MMGDAATLWERGFGVAAALRPCRTLSAVDSSVESGRSPQLSANVRFRPIADIRD
jgi:hypothetical protein